MCPENVVGAIGRNIFFFRVNSFYIMWYEKHWHMVKATHFQSQLKTSRMICFFYRHRPLRTKTSLNHGARPSYCSLSLSKERVFETHLKHKQKRSQDTTSSYIGIFKTTVYFLVPSRGMPVGVMERNSETISRWTRKKRSQHTLAFDFSTVQA